MSYPTFPPHPQAGRHNTYPSQHDTLHPPDRHHRPGEADFDGLAKVHDYSKPRPGYPPTTTNSDRATQA